MSRAWPLVLFLIIAMLVPAVTAGTAADPELDDHDDDNTSSAGPCDPALPTCDTVAPTPDDAAEILALWVTAADDVNITIHLQTAAGGGANTSWALAFNVTPTATSTHAGAAEHSISFAIADTTPDAAAPFNTTVVRNANVLEVTLNRTEIGAVGGDAITNIVATVTQSGSRTDVLTLTTQAINSTDTAPDGNASRPFVLSRGPIVAKAAVQVLGGTLTDLKAPLTTVFDGNGTAVVSGNTTRQTTAFSGSALDAVTGNARVVFDAVLNNTGSDRDTISIGLFDPSQSLAVLGLNVSVTSPAGTAGNTTTPTLNFTLLPGETAPLTITIEMTNATDGLHTILLGGTTSRGGIVAAGMTVLVPSPPLATVDLTPPPTSTPSTGGEESGSQRNAALGLGFLSSPAEGMGLDGPFGSYAELVFLAIVLLLVVLIIFLVLMLVARSPLTLDIEPRVVTASPGQTVDFDVRIGNTKGRNVAAVARFEGDPEWETALAFGGAATRQQGVDADMHLAAKGAGGALRDGRLHVTVPKAAANKESDRITVTIAEVNDLGRQVGARTASVRIRAVATDAGNGPIRLASVSHDPEHPAVGQIVETSAHLENDSDGETYHLRVVLNVDGEDLQERTMVLTPRTARDVVFTWQVPEGASKVKVRVYPVE